ncbi:MAG TPA: GldG family protein [bacterium]|nr:GldG family protein [bacterium]
MNLNQTFIRIRSLNVVFLSVGMALLLGGILAVLVLDTTSWWNITLMALGLVLLILFLSANLADVKAVGKRRGTVVRANLTLVSVAMAGIIIGLNYIVSRHPFRYDMTSNKIYTLSDQTLEILGKLKQEVDVTMITSAKRSSAEIQKAQQLLEEYGKHSTKFRLKVVDGDRNPAEVQKLRVTEANTVVFESGANRKDVLQRDYITYSMMGRQPVPKFQGEAAFTSALLKMVDDSHKTFYLTEGHGERDLNSPQGDGLNGIKELLEKENYTVKSLNLLTSGKIPEDATLIGIIGPEKPFQNSEEVFLRDYLKKGGKMVLCVDPMVHSGLDALLKDFGLSLDNDYLVDMTMSIPPDPRNIVPQYMGHSIVQKLADSRVLTIMPFMRSIHKGTAALEGVVQGLLMQTTSNGYGGKDFKARTLKREPGDLSGPLDMGYACEYPVPGSSDKKARLVVIGGSNFMTNNFLQAPGNGDLAINCFSWAAEDENKISIHPKTEENRTVNLTTVSANLIKYVAVGLIPFGTLLLGGVVWYRRRSL